jgi:formylmethanofuran dehydrogenase subunit E
MALRTNVSVVLLVFASFGCARTPVAPAPVATHAMHGERGAHATDRDTEALEAVARAHGGAGPWAVAGYRMGVYAIAKLALPRGSFDLEVRHESPAEVQFSCVADGAQAATGASMGKLNLTHAVVPRSDLKTIYRKKSTGETLVLRPSKSFVARFDNVPRERLGEAGRAVLHLPDGEVFEEVK